MGIARPSRCASRGTGAGSTVQAPCETWDGDIAIQGSGDLATITSAEEAEHIGTLLTQFVWANLHGYDGGDFFHHVNPWIGGFQADVGAETTQSLKESGWSWITGEGWGYTNWEPGNDEPSDSQGAEDCLQIGPYVQVGYPITWSDYVCYFKSSLYILEYDVPPTGCHSEYGARACLPDLGVDGLGAGSSCTESAQCSDLLQCVHGSCQSVCSFAYEDCWPTDEEEGTFGCGEHFKQVNDALYLGYCGCLLDCWDKTCGDDGCGGTCGTCPDGASCSEGACVGP